MSRVKLHIFSTYLHLLLRTGRCVRSDVGGARSARARWPLWRSAGGGTIEHIRVQHRLILACVCMRMYTCGYIKHLCVHFSLWHDAESSKGQTLAKHTEYMHVTAAFRPSATCTSQLSKYKSPVQSTDILAHVITPVLSWQFTGGTASEPAR
eukprot:5307080-Prymnesium_polylepis.1